MPAWLEALPDRPTVYVTLGTVINALSAFRVLLDGLADSTATSSRPSASTTTPPCSSRSLRNACVERYVSQAFVLPLASVVVSHAGSGAALAAFAHGLPMLLCPRAPTSSRTRTDARARRRLVLMPGEVTAEAVRGGVET